MRLIDADELLKDFDDDDELDGVGVKYIINRQPTIEQKHGQWIVRTDFGNGCREIKCSECGKTAFWRNQPLYCPFCGAKMDEVTE